MNFRENYWNNKKKRAENRNKNTKKRKKKKMDDRVCEGEKWRIKWK